MIAVVPGYISRSVAGSYDNEGTHLMCMVIIYHHVNITKRLFLKSLSALLFRYCHFLHAVDLLHVDQGCQNRLSVLVLHVRSGLLLHGEQMMQIGVEEIYKCMLC